MIFQSTIQNTAAQGSALQRISSEVAKKLRENEKDMGGVKVSIRPLTEQEEARKELEEILVGDGEVYLPYAKNVLEMYDYATTHFHRVSKSSMLADIENGVEIHIGNYVARK